MKFFFFVAILMNASLNATDMALDFPAIIDAIEGGTYRHQPQVIIDALMPYARDRHHLLARGYLWLFWNYPKVFFKGNYQPSIWIRGIANEFENDLNISLNKTNSGQKMKPSEILESLEVTAINSLGRNIIVHYLEPAFCINEFYQGYSNDISVIENEMQLIFTLLTNTYVNNSGRSFYLLEKILNSANVNFRLKNVRRLLKNAKQYRTIMELIEEQTLKTHSKVNKDFSVYKNAPALINLLWFDPLKVGLSELLSSPLQSFTNGDYEFVLGTNHDLAHYQKEYFVITSLALGHSLSLGVKMLGEMPEYSDRYLEFLYDGVGTQIVDLLPKSEDKPLIALAQRLAKFSPDKAWELNLALCAKLSHEMLPRMQRNPASYCGYFNYRRNGTAPLNFPFKDGI